MISFTQVTSAYLYADAPENPAERSFDDLNIVFEDLSLVIPDGLVSVLGPNGVGKSTLLLLAGGRLAPLEGSVEINGVDTERFRDALTNPDLEFERSQLVSFVYQNMEFEADEPLETLLGQVGRGLSDRAWRGRVLAALDLEPILGKQPQTMAKGELQRAVIALSLAYGSPITIMDEPVFALEDHQKRSVFGLLRDYCREQKKNIMYSAHDIDLCRDYPDQALLLWRKDDQLQIRQGDPAEICSRASLEEAYQTPLALLHRKETLYREMLQGKG